MEDVVETSRTKEDTPFIHLWCQHYGLSELTAQILETEDIRTIPVLLNVTEDTVDKLPLTVGQGCLLRGAIRQFQTVDFKHLTDIMKRRSKRVEEGIGHACKYQFKAAAKDEKEKKMTTEEVARRMEMRRRLRKKKSEEAAPKGPSLLERIMLERRVIAAAQAVREKTIKQEGSESPAPSVGKPEETTPSKQTEEEEEEEPKDLEQIDEELDGIIQDIMRKPSSAGSPSNQEERGRAGRDAIDKANQILDGGLFTDEELELARQAQENGLEPF